MIKADRRGLCTARIIEQKRYINPAVAATAAFICQTHVQWLTITDSDTMAATLPLREALNESISSGRLEDTKIILYSRRDHFGTVSRPRALYASSHVLKTVPYFNDRKSLPHFPHGSAS